MTAVTPGDLDVLIEAVDIVQQALQLESGITPHAGNGSLLFAQMQARVAKLALHAVAHHLARYLADRPAPPSNLRDDNPSLDRRFQPRSLHAR